MAKKTEKIEIVDLINNMTEEERSEFVEDLVYEDSTSENPMPKLDIYYPIIKQSQTTIGDDVKVGNIFMPDIDEIEFKDGLKGLIIYQFKERNYVREEGQMPECISFNMQAGTRHGKCIDCPNSKWGDDGKTPPPCATSHKFIMLAEIDGELTLVQVKAAKSSYQEMTKQWRSLTSKTRGKFYQSLINFKSKKVQATVKGKARTFYVWTAEFDSKIKVTPEAKKMMEELKEQLAQYNRDKFDVLKQFGNNANQGGAFGESAAISYRDSAQTENNSGIVEGEVMEPETPPTSAECEEDIDL